MIEIVSIYQLYLIQVLFRKGHIWCNNLKNLCISKEQSCNVKKDHFAHPLKLPFIHLFKQVHFIFFASILMYQLIPMLKITNSIIVYFDFTFISQVIKMINQKHGDHSGLPCFKDFFLLQNNNLLLAKGCMLPKLIEIYGFQTLKLIKNYYYIVTCRVTPLQNYFEAQEGQNFRLFYDSYEYWNIVFRIQGIFPYPLEVNRTVQHQPSLFGC